MVYATKADLAGYLVVEESALPENSQRLLNRASELVDQVTRGRVDQQDPDQVNAAKLATVAQVEYWQMVGEEAAIIGPTGATQIGDFRMDGSLPKLAPRAKGYLSHSGLLSAAVSMKGGGHNQALVDTFFGRGRIQ